MFRYIQHHDLRHTPPRLYTVTKRRQSTYDVSEHGNSKLENQVYCALTTRTEVRDCTVAQSK